MIVIVAAAGGVGAALRLAADGLIRSAVGDRMPWGTLAINVVGSFCLGALVGTEAGARTTAVLGTGLLGGFTTFSAASFESAVLLLERRRLGALGYALGTAVAALAAAALGHAITA